MDIEEAYINLACRIGAVRAYEYAKALLKGDSAEARHWERKLRGPITALGDSEMEKLRKMAYAGKIVRPKDY